MSVPLRADKLGAIDVDNGYGVRAREREKASGRPLLPAKSPQRRQLEEGRGCSRERERAQVVNNFGVGVPFTGVGVNTGTAVAFPSVDTFLGR